MKRFHPFFTVGVILLGLVALSAQDRTGKFDESKMRTRIKTLSSDAFEGRGPGTAGGKKASEYIAAELKSAGVEPGNGTSYFQQVKLIGVKAGPNTSLIATAKDGSKHSFKFGDDFVATTGAQVSEIKLSSDIVFVGYGITAPEYNWNDYKGDPAQYKGKWLMILVNDPPATKDEPGLFGGKALTYYGRWTYKYEEAARHGAAGVILVHTDSSAGYGWNVVKTSFGSWRYEIAREPNDKTPFLNVKAWMTHDAAQTLLTAAGAAQFEELEKAARSRDFKSVDLKTNVSLDLTSELTRVESPNVVGIVRGSDPVMSKEFVIYSAHWDHLGVGLPDAKGDKIYNGAYDNASGVAAVLGIAEAAAKTPIKERPKRSFLFLLTTAEEQGLLGAEWYSQHPLVPLAKTAADINLDGVNMFGKVDDFIALGANRSSIIEPIEQEARVRKFTINDDPDPEQGYFFRSDHFPFAKVGVPSVNFQHGEHFIGNVNPNASTFLKDYTEKYYHQASDEYHDWFDTSAMVQESEFALAFGIRIANAPEMPRYKAGDEFAAPDAKRMSGSRVGKRN